MALCVSQEDKATLATVMVAFVVDCTQCRLPSASSLSMSEVTHLLVKESTIVYNVPSLALHEVSGESSYQLLLCQSMEMHTLAQSYQWIDITKYSVSWLGPCMQTSKSITVTSTAITTISRRSCTSYTLQILTTIKTTEVFPPNRPNQTRVMYQSSGIKSVDDFTEPGI
ncbi:hypothetical protein BKA63DRAFT_138192 [Paraphoma chrysanthemicola]|nr:hypothetical protein BKA63DRAFT_138192 [Paraphoma chrysanthemicola]